MRPLSEQQLKDRANLAMREHMEANRCKELFERIGYDYIISFYGVLRNKRLQRHEYRKIEVFLNAVPSLTDVLLIKQFFDQIKPPDYFSVWSYDCKTQNMKFVEGW